MGRKHCSDAAVSYTAEHGAAPWRPTNAFMQKSAGFPCSEALPERYRLKAPISDRELGQFEQPAFNRLGRAQVPGDPPSFLPGLNNRSSAAFEAACVGASPAPGASSGVNSKSRDSIRA